MEQEYNLQCSELNAARERISLLLQQLERSEKIVSIIKENCQKEKDNLKHKVLIDTTRTCNIREGTMYVYTCMHVHAMVCVHVHCRYYIQYYF